MAIYFIGAMARSGEVKLPKQEARGNLCFILIVRVAGNFQNGFQLLLLFSHSRWPLLGSTLVVVVI